MLDNAKLFMLDTCQQAYRYYPVYYTGKGKYGESIDVSNIKNNISVVVTNPDGNMLYLFSIDN